MGKFGISKNGTNFKIGKSMPNSILLFYGRENMKIKNILNKAIEILKENSIEQPVLKTRMILTNILNKSKEYIMIHDEEEINIEKQKEFFVLIERLKNNEPIQYILNKQEFMGINLFINENVLIPQPDTEILVEEVIDIAIKNIEKKEIKILDLCTGSGAIGIALAKNLDKASIYASDISKLALEVAEKNARNSKVKMKFIESDLFEKFSITNKFDIIVSNPPYIETETIKNLSEEVKHEPKIALDGGQDGLDFYRKIIILAKRYLNENGYLALEIGYDQKEVVENMLKENNYKNVYSKKDLSQNDRIVIAQTKTEHII